MGDDLAMWRARIGTHQHRMGQPSMASDSGKRSHVMFLTLSLRLCMFYLLVTSMSVESNPGPETPPRTPAPSTQEKRHQSSPSTSTSSSQTPASPLHEFCQPRPSPSTSTSKKPWTIRSPATQRAARSIIKKNVPWHSSPTKTRSKARAKQLFSSSNQPKRAARRDWKRVEDIALVRFAAANPQVPGSDSWPQMGQTHSFWHRAATHISRVSKEGIRSDVQVRSRMVNHMRKEYLTVSSAMTFFGLVCPTTSGRDDSSSVINPTKITQAAQLLKTFSTSELNALCSELCKQHTATDLEAMANQLFLGLVLQKAKQENCQVDSNPHDFANVAAKAMVKLTKSEKPNVLYSFAKCIAQTRPGSEESLLPLHRMPFGLIQYQIEFFASGNSSSVGS